MAWIIESALAAMFRWLSMTPFDASCCRWRKIARRRSSGLCRARPSTQRLKKTRRQQQHFQEGADLLSGRDPRFDFIQVKQRRPSLA